MKLILEETVVAYPMYRVHMRFGRKSKLKTSLRIAIIQGKI
jgi:hypothetical protein